MYIPSRNKRYCAPYSTLPAWYLSWQNFPFRFPESFKIVWRSRVTLLLPFSRVSFPILFLLYFSLLFFKLLSVFTYGSAQREYGGILFCNLDASVSQKRTLFLCWKVLKTFWFASAMVNKTFFSPVTYLISQSNIGNLHRTGGDLEILLERESFIVQKWFIEPFNRFWRMRSRLKLHFTTSETHFNI